MRVGTSWWHAVFAAAVTTGLLAGAAGQANDTAGLAAGSPRLSSALRRCLGGLDARLLDSSDPAALQAGAGGQQWSAIYSGVVPLAVLYPRTSAAVAGAITCARLAGVKVTARSGGGSFMGYSVRGGTLTLDLTDMSRVAVSTQKLTVKVQGGARLGQVYAQVFQQAGPRVAAVAGTCPNVGVGGHILGGGYGLLTPAHGLACDQLISLTMVIANGSLITATAKQNQDLFAASCGSGGGNFGIVTEYKLRLKTHPLVSTLGFFDISAKYAVDFLVHWQNRLLPDADGRLFCEVHLNPDGGVSVTVFLPGSKAALNAELVRLGLFRTLWLPASRLPDSSMRQVTWIQAMIATAGSKARNSTLQALLDFDWMVAGRPVGFAEKSWFAMKPLSASAFAAIIKVLKLTGASGVLQSSGLKTAVRRRKPEDTAFPWRSALYFLKAAKRVRKAADRDSLRSTMDQIDRAVVRFFPGAPAYVNYIDEDVSADPLASYFGKNLGWLEQVKAKYDPTSYFSTNPLSIPGATSRRLHR